MNTISERSGIASLTIIVLIVTFCLSTFDITEHDYWWHLSTGKYILAHRAIPHMDVFSYTATRPWIAHYWLADVVGYALYRVVATPGMIVLNALAITFSFWVVLRIARAAFAAPLIAESVTLLAVYASRSRFYVRPETFSFLLMALYLALYYRWKRSGGKWQLLVFPFLQLLWINLYGGGSVIGLLLLACFSAGEVLNLLLPLGRETRKKRGEVFGLLLSALAAFGLSFINPNTYHTVFYFLMSRDPIFRHIVEWRHMELKELLGIHGLLLGLGGILLIRFAGSTDFVELSLFAVFAALSVDAPRSLPFFAIVSVPIIASRARRILESWRERGHDVGRILCERWLQCIFVLGVVVFSFWYLVKDIGKFQSDYIFGFGVNMKLVPVESVDFIEENGVQGPIFNSYGIGGYLIWRLYPQMKVFVDGRVEMYGTDFLKTYMLYWQPEVWEGYVKKYGINAAVIDREPNYTTQYLDESGQWTLVFFDDRAMVYLRNVPQNAALIGKYGYRYIRPASGRFDYLDRYLSDSASSLAVVNELKRSLHNEIYNLNVHLMLGYCYVKMGAQYFPLALHEYEVAARLMPEGKDIQKKIEWVEQQMGRRSERAM